MAASPRLRWPRERSRETLRSTRSFRATPPTSSSRASMRCRYRRSSLPFLSRPPRPHPSNPRRGPGVRRGPASGCSSATPRRHRVGCQRGGGAWVAMRCSCEVFTSEEDLTLRSSSQRNAGARVGVRGVRDGHSLLSPSPRQLYRCLFTINSVILRRTWTCPTALCVWRLAAELHCLSLITGVACTRAAATRWGAGLAGRAAAQPPTARTCPRARRSPERRTL